MPLTIASFHARLTSSDRDRLLDALRTLCRLDALRHGALFDPIPPGWPVWDAAE
jgi:hypothetical protein